MYEQELKEFGLTDNEIKVYLIILENGILNPTQLAKKTGLHRSYLYDTLTRLLDKGIINTVLIKNKKHYQSVNPKVLREIFELKLSHLDSIIPKLSDLYKAVKQETRVELHSGKRVYRTLIKDVIANAKTGDTVLLIGVDEESLLSQVEPIYLRQYFNIIKKKNIREKVILKKGKKQFRIANVQHKELDPQYIGDVEQIIYADKVAIFIAGNPYQLIIIESKEVTETYRKQFSLLWNIAK